jgi:hypothetical protein
MLENNRNFLKESSENVSKGTSEISIFEKSAALAERTRRRK